MLPYTDFLKSKLVKARPLGFNPALPLNPWLKDFQADIATWAVKRGRAAIWADCGLGKTLMQLEWARQVALHTGKPVLILAPLAVGPQTVREGEKFGIPVILCQTQADVQPGINVTNYEKLHLFDPAAFAGVVLDESGILKSFMGATKTALVEAFAQTPYRLCCTATPAPNDWTELLNHAQFLGVMDPGEALTRWFINDTTEANHLRLKQHGEAEFWNWVTSWAVALRRPSDLGYSDDGFVLPPLNLHQINVEVDQIEGRGEYLFRMPDLSATTIHREMRLTASDRARAVADLVNASSDTWVVWCHTNYEADELVPLIPDAVEVRGSDSDREKERKLNLFSTGQVRVIITKPEIAGFGLNWQHCSHTIFVGLSYSFETLYQALRRLYRYGQVQPVEAYLVVAETEGAILTRIEEKMSAHEEFMQKMIAVEEKLQIHEDLTLIEHIPAEIHQGLGYKLYHGDCVECVQYLADNSVGLSVFSPPFSSLYTYSPAMADMGNCEDDEEFFEHFAYLIKELYRVTKPGRLCVVHCKNLPRYKSRYGVTGLRDFRGDTIRAFEGADIPGGRWVYHSETQIWIDPVREMQRTKVQRLLHKQVCKDSTLSGMGVPEFLVVFRKWSEDMDTVEPVTRGNPQVRFTDYIGEEPPAAWEYAYETEFTENEPGNLHETFGPSKNPNRKYSIAVWQRYASPVWFDITRTDVLNAQIARENEEEKHLAPLQLTVIARAIELWSNPGDLVLDPFTGIGSTGYQALKQEREFVGIELKDSYLKIALENLERAVRENSQMTLFDMVAE